MEQVGKLKLYSSEEVLDKHFGKVGTPVVTSLKGALPLPYTPMS